MGLRISFLSERFDDSAKEFLLKIPEKSELAKYKTDDKQDEVIQGHG